MLDCSDGCRTGWCHSNSHNTTPQTCEGELPFTTSSHHNPSLPHIASYLCDTNGSAERGLVAGVLTTAPNQGKTGKEGWLIHPFWTARRARPTVMRERR